MYLRFAGFLCPVHTPDGAPCGLLNHLSHTCQIVVYAEDTASIPALAVSFGMLSSSSTFCPASYLSVNLDGCIIGYIDSSRAAEFCRSLRYLKVARAGNVPASLEITHIEKTLGGLFPGVYLFASPSRMVRPVIHLESSAVELIGTFEQVFLNIAVCAEERYEATTHMEQSPGNILSVVAHLTPFSDLNQSPRNMYQCQMAKQTMGTPLTAYPHRTDNSIYRLYTPQVPLVRSVLYDYYGLDSYPLGTNAIVAVISYTGYDMEDAMILNKASVEVFLSFYSSIPFSS
jgi:DNA-directed RNA polymerase I subunit RPA2